VILHWNPDSTLMPDGYHIYRSSAAAGPYTRQTTTATPLVGWVDKGAANGTESWYYVRAVSGGAVEGPSSDTISAIPAAFATDSVFLDYVQRAAIDYFWYEANPVNGLIRDRSQRGSPASIAAVGFGLSAIHTGVDRGWISRTAARDRVLATLRTFWEAPQGTGVSGTIGYRGFFYHFLELATATRMASWDTELSSIDTGLLLAGILDARQYFDRTDPAEAWIRELADSIYARVEWDWMRNGGASLSHGWNPSTGFLPYRWVGYNEGHFILAIGARPMPYQAPGHGRAGTAGSEPVRLFVPRFPPFRHQYTHCGSIFAPTPMRHIGPNMTYAENTRRQPWLSRHTVSPIPAGSPATDAGLGLTACDGPTGTG
jgi:hypothetical protein